MSINLINHLKNNEEEKKENKKQENEKQEDRSIKSTIIKKVNNKIIIEHLKPYSKKVKNEDDLFLKNYLFYQNKMINNWNCYRDEINELLGSRSPYFYYKEEIQKMYEEELYIKNEIENKNEDDDDDDYLSDEENNLHLIF